MPFQSTFSLIPDMYDNNFPSVEEFLCAILRGENPPWPQAAVESFVVGFLERVRYHGVLPLVHDRLQRRVGRNRFCGYAENKPSSMLCGNCAIRVLAQVLAHGEVCKYLTGKRLTP